MPGSRRRRARPATVRGLHHQCLSDGKALLHAAGELCRVLVQRMAEADLVQHLRGLLTGIALAASEQTTQQWGARQFGPGRRCPAPSGAEIPVALKNHAATGVRFVCQWLAIQQDLATAGRFGRAAAAGRSTCRNRRHRPGCRTHLRQSSGSGAPAPRSPYCCQTFLTWMNGLASPALRLIGASCSGGRRIRPQRLRSFCRSCLGSFHTREQQLGQAPQRKSMAHASRVIQAT